MQGMASAEAREDLLSQRCGFGSGTEKMARGRVRGVYLILAAVEHGEAFVVRSRRARGRGNGRVRGIRCVRGRGRGSGSR